MEEEKGEEQVGDGNLLSDREKENINSQKSRKTNQSIWERIIAQTLKESKSKWTEKLHPQKENQSKCWKTEKGFHSEDGEIKELTLSGFVKQKYNFLRKRMETFIVIMYTHLPTCFISLKVVKKMIKFLGWLKCLATMSANVYVTEEVIKDAFTVSIDKEYTVSYLLKKKNTQSVALPVTLSFVGP